MLTCRICGRGVELDDVVVRFPSGRCVCLWCLDQIARTPAVIPANLRRELSTP